MVGVKLQKRHKFLVHFNKSNGFWETFKYFPYKVTALKQFHLIRGEYFFYFILFYMFVLNIIYFNSN